MFVLMVDGGGDFLANPEFPNFSQFIQDNHTGIMDTYNHTVPCTLSTINGRTLEENKFRLWFWDTKGDTGNIFLKSHRQVKGPYLWEYLNNYRQIYVNVPTTRPAEPINGIMICGILAGLFEEEQVYPADFNLDNYTIDLDMGKVKEEQTFHKVINQRTDMICKLIDEDCQFFYGSYTVTDRILHKADNFDGDESIRRVWQSVDKGFGRILNELDDSQEVLIFGDHGQTWKNRDHNFRSLFSVRTDRFKPLAKYTILDVFPSILASYNIDVSQMAGNSFIKRGDYRGYKQGRI